MLKREITYKDFFTDEEVTEVFYFNLTKSELKEMQFSVEGGFGALIERAMDQQSFPVLYIEFKKLILAAFGVRGEDGRSFNKSPEISEAFTKHPAYDALINELTEKEGAIRDFFVGIIPNEVIEGIDFDKIVEDAKERVAPALGQPVETTAEEPADG